MKIRKTLVVSVVAVVVLGALGAAGAAVRSVRGHRDGGSGDRMIGRLVDDTDVQERLGLSSDQIARLKEIRDDAKSSIRELRAQAIKTRADLRAAMLDTKTSRQDLEKRAAEVRESVGAISQEVTKRLLDARDVLSVDQREKLRTIIRERVGTARRGVMRWRRHHQDRVPLADADSGSSDEDSAPQAD